MQRFLLAVVSVGLLRPDVGTASQGGVSRGDDDLSLSVGHRYLFSLVGCDSGEAVHAPLRADEPSRRKELMAAIKRAAAERRREGIPHP